MLACGGLDGLFEARVDDLVAEERKLHGKRARHVPGRAPCSASGRPAAVFEDALAGVAAGRAGNFGFVVGVDRVGQAEELPSTARTSS